MRKNKLWIISTALTAFLLLAPSASQALPFASFTAPEDTAARLLDKVARWLDGLDLRASGRRTHAATPRGWVQPKNGCGIDPQGQTTCNPGNNNPNPPGNGG